MVKILVADNDMDSYKLVRDILEINFREVKIERALDSASLLIKIKQTHPRYHLILLNMDIQKEGENNILSQIKEIDPDVFNSIIVMTSQGSVEPYPNSKYQIPKPFSLDTFGEVVKKACSKK